jgi:hypothetical protein
MSDMEIRNLYERLKNWIKESKEISALLNKSYDTQQTPSDDDVKRSIAHFQKMAQMREEIDRMTDEPCELVDKHGSIDLDRVNECLKRIEASKIDRSKKDLKRFLEVTSENELSHDVLKPFQEEADALLAKLNQENTLDDFDVIEPFHGFIEALDLMKSEGTHSKNFETACESIISRFNLKVYNGMIRGEYAFEESSEKKASKTSVKEQPKKNESHKKTTEKPIAREPKKQEIKDGNVSEKKQGSLTWIVSNNKKLNFGVKKYNSDTNGRGELLPFHVALGLFKMASIKTIYSFFNHPDEPEAVSKEALQDSADLLYRHGYVERLSRENDETLYALSKAGEQLFFKASLKEKVKAIQPFQTNATRYAIDVYTDELIDFFIQRNLAISGLMSWLNQRIRLNDKKIDGGCLIKDDFFVFITDIFKIEVENHIVLPSIFDLSQLKLTEDDVKESGILFIQQGSSNIDLTKLEYDLHGRILMIDVDKGNVKRYDHGWKNWKNILVKFKGEDESVDESSKDIQEENKTDANEVDPTADHQRVDEEKEEQRVDDNSNSPDKLDLNLKEEARSNSDEEDLLEEGSSQVIIDAIRCEDEKGLTENLGTIVRSMLEEDQVIEFVVLLKSMTLIAHEPKIYHKLYDLASHATNLPLDAHAYTSNNLGIMEGFVDSYLRKSVRHEGERVDRNILTTLVALAYLWGLFLPRQAYDYALTEFSSRFDFVLPEHDILKRIFGEFEHVFSVMQSGFNQTLLHRLQLRKDYQSVQNKLSKKAEEYLEMPSSKVSIKGFIPFLHTLFGKSSTLHSLLEKVVDNRSQDLEKVKKSLIDTYGFSYDNEQGLVAYDEDMIYESIDQAWSANSKWELRYRARATLFHNITRRLEVIQEWCNSQADARKLSDDQAHKIEEHVTNIISIIDEGLNEKPGEDSDPAVRALVFNSLSHVKKILETKTIDKNGLSPSPFWQTPHVMTENSMPIINEKAHEVYKQEPWRNVLRHVVTPRVSLEQAAEYINDSQQDAWFNNFGTYEQIMSHLKKELPTKLDESKQNAKRKAQHDLDKLSNELEFAHAHGRLDEQVVERLKDFVDAQQKFYLESDDYAYFRRFIASMRKRIEKLANSKYQEYRQRYELALENNDLNKEQRESLAFIKNHIKGKRFSLAEEYLNRLAEDGQQILPKDILGRAGSNYHREFLERYDKLHTICKMNRSHPVHSWAYKKLYRGNVSDKAMRHRRSAESLLENWPHGKTGESSSIQRNEDKIKLMLDELGFTCKKASLISHYKDKHDVYRLTVIPISRNKSEYIHPVALFGTKLLPSTRVVSMFGTYGPNEIINDLTANMDLPSGTIVLIDTSLPLSTRRTIAEQFKKKDTGKTLIIIDRTLILYLATLDASDRMSAMLSCTLPYTVYQPFVDGSGVISDEMFIGRKEELRQILSPEGPSLLYGGRQLGKTALLLRARSQKHLPEKKRYALYINALKMSQEDLLKELVHELFQHRIISKRFTTYNDLFNVLAKRIHEGLIDELTLYIDESDCLLDQKVNGSFDFLIHFISLKTKVNEKFRYLFAGLHNVVRYKNALQGNSVLPQLGNPLCIRPLSQSDAFALIETPLSYLGFVFEEDPIALILSNSLYFPGILHAMGHALVSSVAVQYAKNNYKADNNPPYRVDEDYLLAIFNDQKINQSIKEKVQITLGLDQRYMKLATVFSYLYHTDKEDSEDFNGYSAHDIKAFANQERIDMLTSLDDKDLSALMLELTDMGILMYDQNVKKYRLRKSSFRDMIASSEDRALELLLEEDSTEQRGMA